MRHCILHDTLTFDEFQVAKSAIFDFCDEESPFIVNMMLKHMSGATYDRQILALKCGRHVAVAVHIYAYIIADKYDCPSMRIAIIAAVNSELATTGAFWKTPIGALHGSLESAVQSLPNWPTRPCVKSSWIGWANTMLSSTKEASSSKTPSWLAPSWMLNISQFCWSAWAKAVGLQ